MRTILILQNPDIVPLLKGYLRSLDHAIVVNNTAVPILVQKKQVTILNQMELSNTFYGELALTAEDRVIFDCSGTPAMQPAAGSAAFAVCSSPDTGAYRC